MKSFSDLPDGFSEIYSINLQSNKKIAHLLNFGAVLVGVTMGVLAHFFISPIGSLFDFKDGYGVYFLRLFVLALSAFLYIILHEAVHGVAMKLCGAKK